MLTQTKIAEPTSVNGINVDDLSALIEEVKGDAAKGKTHWRVTSAWQGQTRSRANIDGLAIGGQTVSREFSFDADEPLELGGSNRFANPQEYLIAALNACMVVGYAAQCAIQAVDLAYQSAGGASVYQGSRLERCFRDVHVAGQHVALSMQASLEPVGRVLFGLPPGMARF